MTTPEPPRRPESHTKAMLRSLTEVHAVYMHRATQPFAADLNMDQLLASHFAGMAAYLLAALTEHAPEHVVEEIVAGLRDMADDGEALTEQVWHEAEKRGINPTTLIEAAELRRIKHEAKGQSS